jgi:hypothetical protein
MNTRHQHAWTSALLDGGLPVPAGLRAWNGSDAARRFAVHRNNVVASLVDALADTFPVVQELVGAEFFRAMAGVFVRAQPPRSPLLAQYGERFPAFVEGFAPARSLPYLADVARLEWARLSALHAADAAPLDANAAQAAMAAGESVAEWAFACHPALRLLHARHAAVSLWAAHQGEGDLAHVDPFAPEAALIVRPHWEVSVVRCDPATVAFAHALQTGARFGAAASLAAAVPGFDLTASLCLLLAHGALRAIVRPEVPA